LLSFPQPLTTAANVRVGDALLGPDGSLRVVMSTTTGTGAMFRVGGDNGLVANGPHVHITADEGAVETDQLTGREVGRREMLRVCEWIEAWGLPAPTAATEWPAAAAESCLSALMTLRGCQLGESRYLVTLATEAEAAWAVTWLRAAGPAFARASWLSAECALVVLTNELVAPTFPLSKEVESEAGEYVGFELALVSQAWMHREREVVAAARGATTADLASLVSLGVLVTSSQVGINHAASAADPRVPGRFVLANLVDTHNTTLLNHILANSPNNRVAVINNEFGEEIGIESLIQDARSGQVVEEVFEFGNGCVCCSLKGELQRALDSIMERKDAFDHIVVELTGLGNPGPVAANFWLDEELESKYYLDAIICVVDARYLRQRLAEESVEAKRQLGFADIVIINKLDLLNDPENDLKDLRTAILSVNATTKIVEAERCKVPLSEIIGIGAYSVDHPPLDEVRDVWNAPTPHDRSVSTVSVIVPGAVTVEEVERWLGGLLWSNDDKVYRVKGVLNVVDSAQKYVVQGVGELFEVHESQPWPADEARLNRIVFIGRDLDLAALKQSFEKLVVA
jgi:G3E family GTPase